MSRQGLVQATSSEWIKFRSVRSTWFTYAATSVLCVGLGALFALGRATHGGGAGSGGHATGVMIADPTRVSLQGFIFGEIAIGVIGVLAVSSEYSTGSIRSTLTATPRRWLVLVAKAIVLFTTTLVIGEVCAFIAFFVGQAVLKSKGATTATLSGPDVVRSIVLAGVGLALLALFAMGIGLMIRHTAGAITIYVVLIFVILLVVAALPMNWQQDIGKYLPEILTESMRSPVSGEINFSPFSAITSTLVLLAYAVGSLVGGGILLTRRDA
jgi:ABC-type transport system involved in multi-copper enzyme maturation permease subunit